MGSAGKRMPMNFSCGFLYTGPMSCQWLCRLSSRITLKASSINKWFVSGEWSIFCNFSFSRIFLGKCIIKSRDLIMDYLIMIIDLHDWKISNETSQCFSCQFSSETLQPLLVWDLPIPPSAKHIGDCFSSFLADEEITGWNCSQCGHSKATMTKGVGAQFPR